MKCTGSMELGGTTDCLYRVGNELYVQAYRCSGEVSMGGVRPWGDMWLGDWDRPRYDVTPHTDKAEKVWLRLVNTNRDEVCREFRYSSLHWPSEDIYLHVSCKDTLTQLPPDAVRLAMPRKRRVELNVADGLAAGLNTEYSSDSKEERPSPISQQMRTRCTPIPSLPSCLWEWMCPLPSQARYGSYRTHVSASPNYINNGSRNPNLRFLLRARV